MLQGTKLQLSFLHHLLVLSTRTSTSLDELLQCVLEKALALTTSDAGGGIFIVETSDQALELVASALRGELADTPANLLKTWKQNPRSPALFVVQSGQPYCIDDHQRDPAHFPLLMGSRSSFWVPLLERKRVIGVLHVESSQPRHYTESHRRQLQSLASEVIPAIQRFILRERMAQVGAETGVVGVSAAFLELERQIKLAAASSSGTVLVTGERGSGKELAARAIHAWSDRHNKPFVPVLASALTESLFTDELFGHERHAFTDARRERLGKFQAAEGGTIFLDEIGDLSLAVQSALLRVLERGELQRIGRDLPLRIHVRVIAATNRDLRELINRGRFREDLYDRLSVFEIRVPPLRERPEDIPLLASHFLRKYCYEMRRYVTFEGGGICAACEQAEQVGCATAELYQALQTYDWPGNARELENLIIRLLATVPDEILDVKHLPEQFHKGLASPAKDRAGAEGSQLKDLTLHSVLKKHLEYVLQLAEGNKSQAAKLLGIPRTTLLTMMKKFKL